MYNTKLSDYLPDPDDPEYDAYEARLPAYKKELEERFPQCCAQCEPKVRAQLQQTTYNARTDHMRRMLDQSRTRRISDRLGWRSLLVSAAAVGYAASLTLHLVWHAFASQQADTLSGSCLQWPTPVSCVNSLQQCVGPSLVVGFLCSWWNPKWDYKLQGREGRLAGLERYYKVQILVLGIRLGVWAMLPNFSLALQQQIHAVALILLLLLSGYALQSVKVDTTPLVNWEFEVPKLVSERQYVPPPAPAEQVVSLNGFASATSANLQPWQPPTPPLGEDAMDWTPSQSFDQPKEPRFRNIGPSPFHGTLPALSKRNVKTGTKESRQAFGLPPGHFDKRDRLPPKELPVAAMAEPRFFPQSVDTGLENIFDSVFSLKDDAVKSAVVAMPPAVQNLPIATSAPRMALSLFQFAYLLITWSLWLASDHLLIAFPNIKLFILGLAMVMPCVRLMVLESTSLPFSALLTAELVSVAFLTFQIWNCSGSECIAYGKVATGLLLMLTAQEAGIVLAPKTLMRSQSIPQLSPPAEEQTEPATPAMATLPRKASTETMFSTASAQTTSTASAWKTPKLSAREVDSSGFGMRGLNLGEAYSGNSIAPRRRP